MQSPKIGSFFAAKNRLAAKAGTIAEAAPEAIFPQIPTKTTKNTSRFSGTAASFFIASLKRPLDVATPSPSIIARTVPIGEKLI